MSPLLCTFREGWLSYGAQSASSIAILVSGSKDSRWIQIVIASLSIWSSPVVPSQKSKIQQKGFSHPQ